MRLISTGLRGEFFVVLGLDQFQISGEQELVLQFGGRASGDNAEVNSYLLHFQGKSTWRGAETAEQTAARDRFYLERFRQKWGGALFDLLILNDLDKLPHDLRKAYDQGDFKTVIDALAPPASG
jgi:hypothetical protein